MTQCSLDALKETANIDTVSFAYRQLMVCVAAVSRYELLVIYYASMVAAAYVWNTS